jgi:hypothetical protein
VIDQSINLGWLLDYKGLPGKASDFQGNFYPRTFCVRVVATFLSMKNEQLRRITICDIFIHAGITFIVTYTDWPHRLINCSQPFCQRPRTIYKDDPIIPIELVRNQ